MDCAGDPAEVDALHTGEAGAGPRHTSGPTEARPEPATSGASAVNEPWDVTRGAGWGAHPGQDPAGADPGNDVAGAAPGVNAATPAAEPDPAGRPVVTYALIALCCVVYALQWLVPGLTEHGDFYPVAAYVEPWRFITAAFLHSTQMPLHLLFNMMGLYAMGQFLEPALGRLRYTALYLLSALGGSVACLLFLPRLDLADVSTQQPWAQSVVGASGAVFGLFAAAFIVLRRSGANATGMIVLFAVNMAMPLITPNIAWQAHVGGAVTGLLLTIAFYATARLRSRWVHVAVVVVCAALLVGAAWAAFAVNSSALDFVTSLPSTQL